MVSQDWIKSASADLSLDIFAAALQRLKADADRAIAVDETYDAQAATRLHVRTIAVLCGGFYRDGADAGWLHGNTPLAWRSVQNYDGLALAEAQIGA